MRVKNLRNRKKQLQRRRVHTLGRGASGWSDKGNKPGITYAPKE